MLETAIAAAEAAGKLLRQNFGASLTVNEATHHDIKLELDVQSQRLITKLILADYPDHAILGEEGVSGPQDADVRWVVDPIDGTVNYFYNIPHYSVSIAAQVRRPTSSAGVSPAVAAPTGTTAGETPAPLKDEWETVAGVVYAPEVDELFAAARGKGATLNGQPIHTSERTQLAEAIVGIGFFKDAETIKRSLQDFQSLVGRVRKMRLMGSAALDVVYIACGRYDAYIEYGIKLWDIAAGQLILEEAGGRCEAIPCEPPHTFNVRMWNGKLPVDDLGMMR